MLILKILNKSISILIGLFFLFYIYKNATTGFKIDEISHYLVEIGFIKLFASSLFYLMSHLLRSLRISVMLEQQNYSLSALIGRQFYTNAVNLVVPFKLGEIYRITEINKLVKDLNKSFITIVAERSIDFFILFCGLFISLLVENYQLFQLKYTIGIGIFFITSVLFVYFVLPENIRSINLFLAKRHKGPLIISFLAASSRIYFVIDQLRKVFKKRYSTILLLSLLIWSFEILGFIYVFGFISNIKIDLLLAFMVFLSSLIFVNSLGLAGIHLAFYIVSTLEPGFMHLEMSYIYQFIIFGPAIFIGICIFIWEEFKKNFGKNAQIQLSQL